MQSQKSVISSYDQIHSKTDKLLEMPSFYHWVLKRLGVSPHSNLLDVATGSGSLIHFAKSQDIYSAGIDISFEAIKKALSRFPGLSLAISDGEKLPFQNQFFDYVTNIGSLEHFINPNRGIKEIKRVLKPSGKAAIFLPNSYYLGDILTKVMLKGEGPSHNQLIDRFHTKNEWVNLIESNGLNVLKTFSYNFIFPRSCADWKYISKRPKRLIGTLISPLIPFNLSYSFLFICKNHTY